MSPMEKIKGQITTTFIPRMSGRRLLTKAIISLFLSKFGKNDPDKFLQTTMKKLI